MTKETETPEVAAEDSPALPTTQLAPAAPRRSSLDMPDVNLTASSPFVSMHAFSVATKMATALAASSMVPDEYKQWILRGSKWDENPNAAGNCLIAIDLSNRLGIGVLEVMQNVDMIHGRPAMRAKLITALVNGKGHFAHELRYEENGKAGSEYGMRAWTTTKDGARLNGPWITKKLVDSEGWSNRKGNKWLTMPEKMYHYRAASWWADLHATHITLGIMSIEEAEDAFGPDTTPTRAQLLEQKLAESSVSAMDTGELVGRDLARAEALGRPAESVIAPEVVGGQIAMRGTRRRVKKDDAPVEKPEEAATTEEASPEQEPGDGTESRAEPPSGEEPNSANLFDVE